MNSAICERVKFLSGELNKYGLSSEDVKKESGWQWDCYVELTDILESNPEHTNLAFEISPELVW